MTYEKIQTVFSVHQMNQQYTAFDMCHPILKLVFVAVVAVAAVQCDQELSERKSDQEYHNFDNTSFSYR